MKYTRSVSTGPNVGHSDSGMSGNSRFMADGCIIAPLIRCEPGVRPFSISATGTSPSCFISDSSSASSCISRFAQARPAGPPPTMATPTSMRSSSASSKPPMNSFSESTGGGNSIGAMPLAMRVLALLRLDCVGELRDDLVQVAHHAQIDELEDRRVLILVDRDDVLRGLHADLVLDRAGDAERQVQLRGDRLAGLADLRGVRVPAGVYHRARRGYGSAESVRERLGELLEALRLAQAATAAHEQISVLDVHVGTTLLAARAHLGLGRPRRELDVDVLDRRVTGARLVDLERVQAADDHGRAALLVTNFD